MTLTLTSICQRTACKNILTEWSVVKGLFISFFFHVDVLSFADYWYREVMLFFNCNLYPAFSLVLFSVLPFYKFILIWLIHSHSVFLLAKLLLPPIVYSNLLSCLFIFQKFHNIIKCSSPFPFLKVVWKSILWILFNNNLWS